MRALFLSRSMLRFKSSLSLLLCLLLMGLSNLHFMRRWRTHAAIVVFPVQVAAALPQRMVSTFYQNIAGNQSLLAANAQLRAENLLLQAKVQQLLQFSVEHKKLQQLISSVTQVQEQHQLVGRVLAVDPVFPRQQIIIDKGARQQVYVGQPVLDGHGILGQVIAVTPLTARVILLDDPQSAIPVESSRTHLRAIAIGRRGQTDLYLKLLNGDNDIKPGDQWVASGLGLRYPAGFPVGVVTKIVPQPINQALQVTLQPAAALNRVREVLLVWPRFPAVTAMARQQLKSSAVPY